MIQLSLTASGDLSAHLRGHSVRVPCSLSGLIFLRSLLHEMERNPDAKIGTSAQPTQSMVDAFLSTHKVEAAPAGLSAAQIAEQQMRTVAKLERAHAKFSELKLDLEGIDL